MQDELPRDELSRLRREHRLSRRRRRSVVRRVLSGCLGWVYLTALFAVGLAAMSAAMDRAFVGADFTDTWADLVTRPRTLMLAAVAPAGLALAALALHLRDVRNGAAARI